MSTAVGTAAVQVEAGSVPAAIARSWLLHPATRLLQGRPPSGADALVLDLEDALPDESKAVGRVLVGDYLQRGSAWVRLNDAASPHWADDVAALAGMPGLAGVMLAKVESAADVERTAAGLRPGTRIVPMVESAASLERAEEIARHPSTFRIAFGVGDFRRDTGIADDRIALAHARSRLVVASVSAGIPHPIDGPTHGTDDDVRSGVAHGRAMGMTGCLVLDPARIEAVHGALSPSGDELSWARGVLTAVGPRDGSYAPTLARAQALLELHRQLTGS